MEITINTTVSAPVSFSRGWTSTYDADTTANIIVDHAGSGDYTTIQAAVSAVASPDTVIAVKEGTYAEAVDFGAAPSGITIKRYGTDRVKITGQEFLTGWTLASAGDEATYGLPAGVAYKKTVTNSTMAVDARSLNIYEAGTPIPICQSASTPSDKFFFTYDKAFDVATSFTFNGSNQITEITDTTVLAGVTAGQLTDSFAQVYHYPNDVSEVDFTAFNDGTDTVTVDGLLLRQSADPADWRWNLCNCLPKITQGTYGFVDNGDGTSTVFLYPFNSANLTLGLVSYAARDHIIDLGTTEAVSLIGLELIGCAGNGISTGICVRKTSNSVKTSGHTVKHCLLGDITNSSGDGYGALFMALTGDCTIENVSIRNAAGSHALTLAGGVSFAPGTGNKVTKCTSTKIALAGARFYTQTDVQFTFCTLTNCGYGGHPNQWNFYEQCDKVLAYGIKTRNCIGYGTWQEASRIYVGMCDMQAGEDISTGRTLVDQTNATAQPTIPSNNRVWNCAFLPNPAYPAGGSSVELGDHYVTSYGSATQPNNISFEMTNCIVNGGGIQEPYVTPSAGETHWRDQVGYDDTHIELRREGNLYTSTAFWQAVPYGWSLNASEALEATQSNVFTDVASADYTAAPSSPILDNGVSVADIVAEAAALFPDFDFTVDADGEAFTPSAPKRGPYQRNWDEQVAWA